MTYIYSNTATHNRYTPLTLRLSVDNFYSIFRNQLGTKLQILNMSTMYNNLPTHDSPLMTKDYLCTHENYQEDTEDYRHSAGYIPADMPGYGGVHL